MTALILFTADAPMPDHIAADFLMNRHRVRFASVETLLDDHFKDVTLLVMACEPAAISTAPQKLIDTHIAAGMHAINADDVPMMLRFRAS